MKERIAFQETTLAKREKLLYAIITNVEYLTVLHKDAS